MDASESVVPHTSLSREWDCCPRRSLVEFAHSMRSSRTTPPHYFSTATSTLAVIAAAVFLITACESVDEKKPKPAAKTEPAPAKPLVLPPAVECRWAEGRITVDGNADEPAWKNAQTITRFLAPWATNSPPAKTRTTARLLWDREFLYFHAEMEDRDLYADITTKDGNTWNNDVFELFFKPALDKPGYYEFQVNAANTQFDLFLPRRASWLVDRLRNDQEFHIESKVVHRGTLNQWRDRDTGWSVEGRIPWRDFMPTGGRPATNEEWRFALCRYDYSVEWENPDLSTTAPLSRVDYHQHENYAPIKFVGQQIGAAGPLRRLPLTTSKIAGSPEPPSPYKTERAFPKLEIKNAMLLRQLPGTDHLVYIDRASPSGSSQFWIFKDDPGVTQKKLALALTNELSYGMAFHPKFDANGHIYIAGNGAGANGKKHTRVTRWTMDRKEPYTVDPQSRQLIIEWESDGHNGADAIFGNDGMLYITSGDGTSDSDTNVTGQRIDLLLSKVLRIDVDNPPTGKFYSVPKDNPFLDTPNARPETWAHGFRNPWRITCDAKTGQIWVGENGQDLWESVKQVERGANYGWSVYEGSHPFYENRKLGPGKLTKPTLEHNHSESRSLTGGVVYYGKNLPDLNGHYTYGDYSTGKIWGALHDGKKLLQHRELVDTPFAITGFGQDTRGNLLVIDDNSGFHYLRPNTEKSDTAKFPRKLSETGLFTSVADHQLQPALIPYSVNAPHWVDGATKEQYLALPPGTNGLIEFTHFRGWNLPEGTVILQTLSLPSGGKSRRIESRILAKQQNEWAGYSYEWNAAQTDATLVDKAGADRELMLADAAGNPQRTPWRIPSRADCMVCHSRAAIYALGFNEWQFNKEHDYGGYKANQLEVLEKLGVFRGDWKSYERERFGEEQTAKGTADIDAAWNKIGQVNGQRSSPETRSFLPRNPENMRRLVNPYDATQDLTARVRSYLHANCSHCHVEAGGGNAPMELEFRTLLSKTRTINVPPIHNNYNLPDPRIIAPGHVENSVMFQRIAGTGVGKMPPVGAQGLDADWIQLLVEWITKMK